MSTNFTKIPECLIRAYSIAEYRVFSPQGIVQLTVGRRNPVLNRLLQQYSASSAALITSDNPKSKILSDEINQKNRKQLALQAEFCQLHYWKTCSTSSISDWPEEHGILVLDISMPQALSLANQFEQNAILWIVPGQPIELVLTRAS